MSFVFRFFPSFLKPSSKSRHEESKDECRSKRHHFGPEDHVVFKKKQAPPYRFRGPCYLQKAPAPATYPVQREANMPRKRKHEQSKDDNFRLKRKRASDVDSSPVTVKSPAPVLREEKEAMEYMDLELADDDTFPPRSPYDPLDLCNTFISFSPAPEEVETTPVVRIKTASASMNYFDTCFNISLQEYGFPFSSYETHEDEPSEASEEAEHEPSAPEEIEATVAGAEASEDEPSEVSEEVEHEPFAPEETETTVARAAAHGIGSKVFGYHRDLNVPRPIPFYSSEESDEEDTRPFDEISINKNPPSEDEASEEEEEDDVISLSSDEGSEDEDHESFDESSDDEDSNDESNDIPARPGLRRRNLRQRWTDRQFILLLTAAEDSRGPRNINWDAVMEHACIEILLEERPFGTRKKFQNQYNDLRKTKNQEKYQSLMAML